MNTFYEDEVQLCEFVCSVSMMRARDLTSFSYVQLLGRGYDNTAYPRRLPLIRTPPLPFGRICFVVLVMRKGWESS